MILAGIDIGTNAARLLIADLTTSSLRTIHAARTVSRLGRDLDRTGMLSREPQERTLAVLHDFSATIARYPVARTMVVGTSALRRASNAQDFVKLVKDRTGLELLVISGAEEARFMLQGVRGALAAGTVGADDMLRSALLIDIGGGSTELIMTRSGTVVSEKSLDIGAVYLTERFLKSVPPQRDQVEALRCTAKQELDVWEQEELRSRGLTLSSANALVGTAGTVTTLAAMDQKLEHYAPNRINGYRLSLVSVDKLIDLLCRTSLAERAGISGLDRGREDIILAGALILRELMERCNAAEMLVSDWGLREGMLISLFESLCDANGAPEVLLP